MEPGHNSVVILIVRLLGIKVDTVCRFRLMAIDWPSAPLGMTGVAQALGTPECTKSVLVVRNLEGTSMVRLLVITVDVVCRFRLTAIDWPSAPRGMTGVAQTLGTRESTYTAMKPGHNSVLILMVRLLVIEVEAVCRFRLTAIDWPSVPTRMMGVAQTLGTRESTNTAMEPGHNSVLILMVRLLVIEVEAVCRFRLTAIDWPSVPTRMTGVAQTLGTRESTNTGMEPGHNSVLILMVRLLVITADRVCCFQLTAIDWPSVPTRMTGVAQTLGTRECTNTAMESGHNSVLILMVRLLVIETETVCCFHLMAIDWPSVPTRMTGVAQAPMGLMGTRESTNTAMESGHKSVLILMVRVLVIEVDGVCRFPLTAADWPSVRTRMTGCRNQRLGTRESTNAAMEPGHNLVLILMVRLLPMEVDTVCRFRLTAIDWPSATILGTG